jgi:hypothetical protein
VVRLVALAVLAAVWIAVLVWLWTDEKSLSCFEYVPLEDANSRPPCAELAEREARRFNAWFLPAVVAGPAAGVVLWFVLRPRRPRSLHS